MHLRALCRTETKLFLAVNLNLNFLKCFVCHFVIEMVGSAHSEMDIFIYPALPAYIISHKGECLFPNSIFHWLCCHIYTTTSRPLEAINEYNGVSIFPNSHIANNGYIFPLPKIDFFASEIVHPTGVLVRENEKI